ncbi:hypothetical protein PIB30_039288 [Stylosanthes scabra]|uniref:Uncharacterized protein n=1 Tax=Stylosanthes scabra TaxID=79078 RepID=A0ABU6YF06_9FABA|nr:hypothetical protein [Stylosanthes scabra]
MQVAEAETEALKDYADYRRSVYGNITHKALLVDVVGTLVIPSQPMTQIYRKIGEKYGVDYSEDEIFYGYRRAYSTFLGQISSQVAAEKPNPIIFLKAIS